MKGSAKAENKLILGVICSIIVGNVLLLSLLTDILDRESDYQLATLRTELEAEIHNELRGRVESAHRFIAYLAENETDQRLAQEKSMEVVASMRFGTDNYLWVHRLDPLHPEKAIMLVHPAATLVGRDLTGMIDLDNIRSIYSEGEIYAKNHPAVKDIASTELFARFNEVCLDRGEGRVEYYWPKVIDGRTSPEGYHKISFVKYFPRWNWVIGAGAYADHIDAAVARRAEHITGSHQTLMRQVLVSVTLMSAVILLLVFLQMRRSLTAKRRQEEELRRAKETAEAASRAKSDFLANMSHEIRTPMNGVIGMTDILLDTNLDREQRDYAETVKKSADLLMVVINDILDFSKIEAGRLELEEIEFDLLEMMEDLNGLMALRAQEKGLEYASLIEPSVSPRLKGDPGRLRQVLTNLIGNAVKFTESGEIFIHVTGSNNDAGQQLLRFSVRDTGIGIPADKGKHLFEAFTQGDISTTRKFGGTGLGLCICKHLIEMMGGDIGMTSIPGRGSTFWFTVQLAACPQVAVPHAPPAIDLHGVRLLCVDDNATNRLILAKQLAETGCRFEEADNAGIALDLLREAAGDNDPFQVVLLDMHMPEIDGITLARTIWQDRQLKDIPLLMMTSIGFKKIDDLPLDHGFAAYLTKPVKRANLHECLRRVVGGESSANPVPAIQAKSAHTPSLARDRDIRILLVEDNLVNQKVAIKILEKLGLAADAAANGREALISLERRNYDLVLMDCQMPVMGGYEATEKIRGWRDSSSRILREKAMVPIVAMTAHAMKGDREKCLAAGMDDYLAKPIDVKGLRIILDRILFRSKSGSPASHPATSD